MEAGTCRKCGSGDIDRSTTLLPNVKCNQCGHTWKSDQPEGSLGYRLGGLVVEFSESGITRRAASLPARYNATAQVLADLLESTDPAYRFGARELARILRKFSDSQG